MKEVTMLDYSPVWPHDDITKIFSGIYIVRGTNITHFEGMKIQHSRNMTIIESQRELTLINTVRLNEEGLKQLDALGTVRWVISIGAFHGRDDAFYINRYNAELWTVQKQVPNTQYVKQLNDADKLPIKNAVCYLFKNATPVEGFLYLKQEGGIIITCDSVKNWLEIDSFFDEETAKRALLNGEISKARISPIWLQATGLQKRDFEPLLNLNFVHLISAHGDVLYNTAYTDIQKSLGFS
jgi:hypothetical protein